MSENRMPRITYCSNRGQGMILVMKAIEELGGRNTKQDIITYITGNGYYDITRHDLPAYNGQSEPRYHTLLAWARKDCVLRNLILNDERDAWAFNRQGREKIVNYLRKFENQDWDICKCYIWRPKFKSIMCSHYRPSDADAQRPEENLEQFLKDI